MPKRVKKMHPTYGPAIVKATGCTEAQSIEVEDLMRIHHGTLDGLPSQEFDREASRCLSVLLRHNML